MFYMVEAVDTDPFYLYGVDGWHSNIMNAIANSNILLTVLSKKYPCGGGQAGSIKAAPTRSTRCTCFHRNLVVPRCNNARTSSSVTVAMSPAIQRLSAA